jgi:hypothetical protein
MKKLVLKELLARHISSVGDLECDKLFGLAIRRKRGYSQ